MRETLIQELLQILHAEYNHPDTVQAFSEHCRDGLFPFEQKVADRFLKPGSRILVLGCGAGRDCFPLAERGHTVEGIDFSERMLSEAKENNQRRKQTVRFAQADYTALPAELGLYDAIFWGHAMYASLPSRKLRVQTLKQAAQHLKPAGMLILTIGWVPENKWLRTLRHWKNRLIETPQIEKGDLIARGPDGKRVSYTHFFCSPDEIAGEFREAGLSVLHREELAWVLQPQQSKILSTSK